MLTLESILVKLGLAILKNLGMKSAAWAIGKTIEIMSIAESVRQVSSCIQARGYVEAQRCAAKILCENLTDRAVDRLLGAGRFPVKIEKTKGGVYVASGLTPRFQAPELDRSYLFQPLSQPASDYESVFKQCSKCGSFICMRNSRGCMLCGSCDRYKCGCLNCVDCKAYPCKCPPKKCDQCGRRYSKTERFMHGGGCCLFKQQPAQDRPIPLFGYCHKCGALTKSGCTCNSFAKYL